MTTAQPRILAINNDLAVLNVFRDLLEEEGYQVTTRLFIEKDMAAIVALAPDLIILDYMWTSDDNGWSLLQMIRMDPRVASIPVVLCTGAVHKVRELGGRLAELGVRVVIKPFNIEELLAVIAELLAVPATE